MKLYGRRIIALLATMVLLFSMTGCELLDKLSSTKLEKSLEKAVNALEDGDFDDVLELVEDDDALAESAELIRAVKKYLKNLRSEYEDGNLDADEVEEILEDMEDLLDELGNKDLLELSEEIAMGLSSAGNPHAPTAIVPTEGIAVPVEPEEHQVYRIGVSIYSLNDYYMSRLCDEMSLYLDQKNVEHELAIKDARNDINQQVAHMEEFIAMGMNLIICNPVNTEAADIAIEICSAYDIPLVLLNREPGYGEPGSYPGILSNPNVYFVGIDPRNAGICQGEMVLNLPNHGDINGDGVISYVMILGDPENRDAIYRAEYPIMTLLEAGLTPVCLLEAAAYWESTSAHNILAEALAQYGTEIEVVFCGNDGMALGAYEAIAACGLDVNTQIYLLGIDATQECCDMIRNGEMTGTVLNDYAAVAHTTIDVALAALDGIPMDSYHFVPYTPVTE